ncbi:MAG: glycosyltransferase 61 family protein [Eubacterium sp.]
MKKYYKKIEKLNIIEIENGIILPQKNIDDGPMWGLGGVCDSNNQFSDASFYDGGWANHGGKYEWTDEDYIDEDVVYIGMFYLHWGHFLIDLTNRMWCLPVLTKNNSNIKVAYLGEEEPSGNNLRFLELLGIKENQLIHIKKPIRFKRVLLPEQGFKSCEWYSDEFVNMFDYMYNTVMNSNCDFSKVDKIEKVYFSRQRFSKAVSSEFGEEFFEKTFNCNGFESVFPETLTLDEQIYLWNNAKEIVCVNGSIPLNVVFSKNKKLKLTILNKTSILHENPYILLQFRNINAEFVDIYREPFKRYPKSLGEGPYLLYPSKQFEEYSSINNLKINGEYYKLADSDRRKYYLYVFSIKRRIKNLLLKILYR